MAIYGSGYRPLRYEPTAVVRRLWAVASQEYRTLFRRRLGVIAFVLCMTPSVANLGILLAYTGVWQLDLPAERLAQFPRLNPETLDFYLVPVIGEIFSFVVFLVLTSLVSCRAIAKDREANALEIYWTRGIEPLGYFLAKWAGSFLLVGTAFVGAPLVIWLLGVVLAPDWGFLERTLPFMPRAALALVLFTAVLTYVAVAFSAVAGTANAASILWFALLVGSSVLGRMLAHFFQGEWWFKAIDPWDAMKRVVEWICDQVPLYDYAPSVALASIALLVAVLTALVLKRMRRAEAIG
jgi:hypothetical protein